MTGGPRRHIAFAVVCLAAVAVFLAAYGNSLDNALQFDDAHVVQENLYIRDLANIPRFFRDATTFSSLPSNAAYRPLVSTTLAIDYWIGGSIAPRQFHRSQLAMFLALGALLTALFTALLDRAAPHARNRYIALAGALWFCVHTANTETGNYISARSEILAALGAAGSLWCYVALPWTRRFHVYLVPMVIGAFAKVPAVVFAPLLLLYVAFFEERLSLGALFTRASRPQLARVLRACAPAFIVGAAMFLFIESMNAPTVVYSDGRRLPYAMTQPFVWMHYARLFVLPVGLTTDTDWQLVTSMWDARLWAGLAFVVALAGAAWSASRTDAWRPVAFGVVWFVVTLLPSSSVFPLAEVANEHRLFLPLAGLVFATMWLGARALDAMARVRAAPAIGGAVAVAVVAAHAVGTHRRNVVWHSDESLWRDVVEKSPRNARALMNYGVMIMSRGRLAEAKSYFERAHPLTPNYAPLEVNLGIVSGGLGDSAAAAAHFARSLELDPDAVAGRYFYARWLTETTRAPEAIPMLERAIALSPATVEARALLMKLYFATGRDSALAALVRETLAIAPGDSLATDMAAALQPVGADSAAALAQLSEGLSLSHAKKTLDAAVAFGRGVRLAPRNPYILDNLGSARAALGFYDDAIPLFERAIALAPGYALARTHLAGAVAARAARATREAAAQTTSARQ